MPPARSEPAIARLLRISVGEAQRIAVKMALERMNTELAGRGCSWVILLSVMGPVWPLCNRSGQTSAQLTICGGAEIWFRYPGAVLNSSFVDEEL